MKTGDGSTVDGVHPKVLGRRSRGEMFRVGPNRAYLFLTIA